MCVRGTVVIHTRLRIFFFFSMLSRSLSLSVVFWSNPIDFDTQTPIMLKKKKKEYRFFYPPSSRLFIYCYYYTLLMGFFLCARFLVHTRALQNRLLGSIIKKTVIQKEGMSTREIYLRFEVPASLSREAVRRRFFFHERRSRKLLWKEYARV